MDRARDRRSGRRPALVGGRKRSGRRGRRLRAPRRLRATRAGWCFIAIVFGVGFAALNTGNNLLYLVLALMLAFLVLSGILSESSLRGIRVERLLPRELFAGAPNRIVLRLHNDQKRNAAFAVTLEDRIEVDDEGSAAGRCFALRVGAGASSDRSYRFEPEARGDVRFVGVRASTRFPFGLFVKSRELDLPRSALVYPEIVPVTVERGVAATREADDRPAGATPDGDEIAGLRDLVPGDSVARVHWRSSLRAGRLLVGIGDVQTLDEHVGVERERIRDHYKVRLFIRGYTDQFLPGFLG